jgi:hypothetical protein
VTLPERDVVEVLAVAVTVTVPVPLQLVPPLTLSQAALLVAVQVHAPAADTFTGALPPFAVKERLVVDNVDVQSTPAWVTVTVWPATVNVPVRGDADVFAVTEKVTVPAPLALLPPVTVIHAALLAAVQLQLLSVLTPTVPVPALAVSERLVAARVNVHGAPAWVTVTVCPAIVSVPVRGLLDGFAVAENATVPLPVPVPPLVTVSQVALLLAVHAHEVPAVMVTDPVLAVAASDTLV